MQSQIYNDLWKIITNLPSNEFEMIPERFRAFIKTSRLPNAEPRVRTDISLEKQDLDPEVRTYLASFSLTYWAKGPTDRREFAEEMHRNEQLFNGEAETPMTEEEYQKLLETFDDWHFGFGPIPFWGRSRQWCPEECYGITEDPQEALVTAGNTYLKPVPVTPEQREEILNEAKQWILVKVTKSKEVLYWHDDYTETWTSTKEIDDFYQKGIVIKDGHFYGAMINEESVSSMGLFVSKDREAGVLFINGTKDGKTEPHYHHSSSEVSEEEDSTFSLHPKKIVIRYNRRSLCMGDDAGNGIYDIEMPYDATLKDLVGVLLQGGNGNDWPVPQTSSIGWVLFSNVGKIADVSADKQTIGCHVDENSKLSALDIRWIFAGREGEAPDLADLDRFFETGGSFR